MNDAQALTVLLQGAPGWVREVQQMLEQAEVKCVTGPVPDSGGAKAWLAVKAADVERAKAAYDASLDRLLHDDKARAAVKAVADLDADETSCPACDTKFATKGVTRCPECGLNFGGP